MDLHKSHFHEIFSALTGGQDWNGRYDRLIWSLYYDSGPHLLVKVPRTALFVGNVYICLNSAGGASFTALLKLNLDIHSIQTSRVFAGLKGFQSNAYAYPSSNNFAFNYLDYQRTVPVTVSLDGYLLYGDMDQFDDRNYSSYSIHIAKN